MVCCNTHNNTATYYCTHIRYTWYVYTYVTYLCCYSIRIIHSSCHASCHPSVSLSLPVVPPRHRLGCHHLRFRHFLAPCLICRLALSSGSPGHSPNPSERTRARRRLYAPTGFTVALAGSIFLTYALFGGPSADLQTHPTDPDPASAAPCRIFYIHRRRAHPSSCSAGWFTFFAHRAAAGRRGPTTTWTGHGAGPRGRVSLFQSYGIPVRLSAGSPLVFLGAVYYVSSVSTHVCPAFILSDNKLRVGNTLPI